MPSFFPKLSGVGYKGCLYMWGHNDVGKDWGQEEKRATEVEMVGWHHRLDGYEPEQIPGDSEGPGNLVCCSPWGCRVRLNNSRVLGGIPGFWDVSEIALMYSCLRNLHGFPGKPVYTFVLHLDVLSGIPPSFPGGVLPRLALCPGHASFMGHTCTVPCLSDMYLRESGSILGRCEGEADT